MNVLRINGALFLYALTRAFDPRSMKHKALAVVLHDRHLNGEVRT